MFTVSENSFSFPILFHTLFTQTAGSHVKGTSLSETIACFTEKLIDRLTDRMADWVTDQLVDILVWHVIPLPLIFRA